MVRSTTSRFGMVSALFAGAMVVSPDANPQTLNFSTGAPDKAALSYFSTSTAWRNIQTEPLTAPLEATIATPGPVGFYLKSSAAVYGVSSNKADVARNTALVRSFIPTTAAELRSAGDQIVNSIARNSGAITSSISNILANNQTLIPSSVGSYSSYTPQAESFLKKDLPTLWHASAPYWNNIAPIIDAYSNRVFTNPAGLIPSTFDPRTATVSGYMPQVQSLQIKDLPTLLQTNASYVDNTMSSIDMYGNKALMSLLGLLPSAFDPGSGTVSQIGLLGGVRFDMYSGSNLNMSLDFGLGVNAQKWNTAGLNSTCWQPTARLGLGLDYHLLATTKLSFGATAHVNAPCTFNEGSALAIPQNIVRGEAYVAIRHAFGVGREQVAASSGGFLSGLTFNAYAMQGASHTSSFVSGTGFTKLETTSSPSVGYGIEKQFAEFSPGWNVTLGMESHGGKIAGLFKADPNALRTFMDKNVPSAQQISGLVGQFGGSVSPQLIDGVRNDILSGAVTNLSQTATRSFAGYAGEAIATATLGFTFKDVPTQPRLYGTVGVGIGLAYMDFGNNDTAMALGPVAKLGVGVKATLLNEWKIYAEFNAQIAGPKVLLTSSGGQGVSSDRIAFEPRLRIGMTYTF